MVFEPVCEQNRALVNAFLRERWFSTDMLIRGEVFDLTRADGFVSFTGGRITGLITYLVRGKTCEITSLDSLQENRGVGAALVEAVLREAANRGCSRVAVVTTNDNMRALRFYQKRGFDLKRLYRDSLAAARQIKPEIPQIGLDGIPLRHEIELEYVLPTGRKE